MRRKACALLLSAALGGCMSTDRPDAGYACSGSWGTHHGPPTVPGVMGANGQSLPMAAPYNTAPPANLAEAQQMMASSVPLDMVQMSRGGNAPGMGGVPGGLMPNTIMPTGGIISPAGVPFGPGIPSGPNVGGVIPANVPPGSLDGNGIMLAQLAGGPAAPNQARFSAQRTQIRFSSPTGMKVAWFTQGPDGRPAFSNVPLEAPARYNFPQGAIYRLKISNIEGRPGLEVYPTMEVVPCNPKTEAFLAHSAVPLAFTQDDFKQIAEGNYVTKVIYLPDPQFQDVAGTGIDEIISTRLEPGADPVQEALRRGSILVIIRMGNVDQEAPNTPPLSAATPAAPHAGPQLTPGMPAQGFMAPYPGYLPSTGALPPGALGGPAGGAGAAPPPPPGFAPRVPPPLPPSIPGTGKGAAPSALVPPPATSIFAPPPPSAVDKKAPAPITAPEPLPPPVPVPSKTSTAPAVPSAPTTSDARKSLDVSVPLVPMLPAAGDAKKTEANVPMPGFPNANSDVPLPRIITPASAPPAPVFPDLETPPAVPAFPATPGTIIPAAPTSSSSSGSSNPPRLPMPSGAGLAR